MNATGSRAMGNDEGTTKLRVGIVAAASIAIVVAVWLIFFRTGDEAEIRAQLAKMAAAVRVDSNEGPVVRLARVRGDLSEVLSDDPTLDLQERGEVLRGKRAIEDGATSLAAAFESLTIEITGARVTIDPGKKSARVDATAKVRGTRGGTPESGERAIVVTMEKSDRWRVARIVVAPPPEVSLAIDGARSRRVDDDARAWRAGDGRWEFE